MLEPNVPRRLAWPGDTVERQRILDMAVETLRGGGLVVFPTDTVYGVAADPDQPDAVARLFALKERPLSKQIALLVSGLHQLAGRRLDVPLLAQQLAERYWPGPLTLVLRDLDGDGSVGVRVPNHPLTLALLEHVGGALATTSANRSSQPSTRTADEVLAQLPNGFELLLDGGPTPGGVDSTVLDLTASTPRILRHGALSQAEIEQVTGHPGR
jgi:L-threonylcarbamoyladenylate synthase